MPRLEPVLMKALAKEPNDRYQSPDGLIKALESVLPGSEPKAVERQRASEAFLAELPTEAQPVEARSRPFVRPIVVDFLAVGVVALTVLGDVAFNGDDGDSSAVAKTQPEATVGTSPTVPSPATVAPSEARTAVPGPTATSLAQVTVAPEVGDAAQAAKTAATIFERASAIRQLKPLQEIQPELVSRRLAELAIQEGVAPRE
jgi:hypothetical protein